MFFQVTVYQCLEGGVIAVLQSYIDEDVSFHNHLWSKNDSCVDV